MSDGPITERGDPRDRIANQREGHVLSPYDAACLRADEAEEQVAILARLVEEDIAHATCDELDCPCSIGVRRRALAAAYATIGQVTKGVGTGTT